MAEVPRAPLGRPPARSWLPGIAWGFLVIVGLAILKPWGTSPSTGPDPTVQPTFVFGPAATERPRVRGYDPRLFGLREPDPAWELWPAGYVVQFGIAGPVRVHGQDDPDASPGASPSVPVAAPSPAAASPGVAPGPSASADPDLEGHVVELGAADHLVALGINTPVEHRVVAVDLRRIDQGRGSGVAVAIVRLPTLWESEHFIVIAPEDPLAAGQPGPWQAGLYRLDLTTAQGEVREVLLRILPPQG